MTMTRLTPRPPVDAIYLRFGELAQRLDGQAPQDDLETFGEFLIIRDALFEDLDLPVTRHNSLRLYDCAIAGADLDAFLGDVDHFWPASIVSDEALFLSALATYFGWRGVVEDDARVYDIEGFLGVPHHRHNTAAVGAWLSDDMGWLELRASLSLDAEWLDYAVA